MSGIINLSRASSIGIHACVIISNSKNRLNVTQVANMLNASNHHVAKVLQKLATAGILNSTKGPAGGFSIAVDPSQINLLRIYEVIQGSLEVSQCPEHSDTCTLEKCVWGDFGNNIRAGFRTYLENTRLSDFMTD